ncbi:MAG TPA: HAMP domain-containing sensor histidine kinase, partial [Solirubrobacteraceae bacterium]|nr:HAMP domain-containing sensor histidine kinase [Solirubrobacteraceae bacterium]
DQVRTALPAVAGAMPGRGAQPGPPRGGPPPGGAPGSGLPPGSYGELRDADGDVIAAHVFSYGQDITADPKLPRDIPLGRVFTVKGENGDKNSYRVFAERDRFGGGVTVAAAPLGEINDRLNRLLAVESLVIVAVLLVLGAVAWAVVRVGLLPLDRMGHTAGAIAGGDLSHRVESTDPRTEVGRLGIALNAMLDRLEHAFSQREASEHRLRRFLADASHELRTPLASIRGYAELFRMGAARDPAEAERAMRRIEDEAARMGVLVEDLLTLARLDEIAEAPHRSVDLGALAEDAVSDARVTAPDRRITLAAGPGTTVLGDAHQLRQVLANLMRNALVHTPAGTGIDVSVANGDGNVRLVVRDHGPGLPTEDPGALFERFWRAEGGRERGRAGAGLGLAIVAAIVDAHGGSVGAANAADGGAVFSVELPVHAG